MKMYSAVVSRNLDCF